MTDQEAQEKIDFIQSLGIDPEEFVFAMMMEALFVDMADSYICHVKDLVKFSTHFHHKEKQTIKHIKDKLSDFAISFSNKLGTSLSPDQHLQIQEGHGDRSDFVRECCMLLVKVKPEDRIKVLSSIKLFVK